MVELVILKNNLDFFQVSDNLLYRMYNAETDQVNFEKKMFGSLFYNKCVDDSLSVQSRTQLTGFYFRFPKKIRLCFLCWLTGF